MSMVPPSFQRAQTPGAPPVCRPQRLRLVVAVLAILCILVGLGSAFVSMTDLSILFIERDRAVEAYRGRALLFYDRTMLPSPLPVLPRAGVARLALLLGDEYFERRGVSIPLAALNLIMCWVLCTGGMGALRRRDFALPMWSWACMANAPLTALSIIASVVLSQEAVTHVWSDAA